MKNYILDDYTSIVVQDIYSSPCDVCVKASVIIVTYNLKEEMLKQCLDGLFQQTESNFEIMVVDNSDRVDNMGFLKKYALRYIKLDQNYGPTQARNVGIYYAKGEIIIFLDDDGVPAANFVEEHIKAHSQYDILGLRGKILPKTETMYNFLPNQYNLGEKVFPYVVNMEGNSSFKRAVLLNVGGFNTDFHKGHEGIELCFRIVQKYGNKNVFIYCPHAIIYHDYCNSFAKYLRREFRHHDYYKEIPSEVFDFALSYTYATCIVPKPNNVWEKIQLELLLHITSLLVNHKKFIRRFYKNV